MTDPFTINLRTLLQAWLNQRHRTPDYLIRTLPGKVCSKTTITKLMAGEEVTVSRKQGLAIASLLNIPADKVVVF